MKKTRKLLGCLFAAAMMTLLPGLPAQARSCTCGQSSIPHRSNHTISYLYYEQSGHTRFCDTCWQHNGHDQFCEFVRWREPHDFTIIGETMQCGCGYSQPVPCEHPQTKITPGADGCVVTCVKCDETVSTKPHTWEYQVVSASSSEFHQETGRCKECGYEAEPVLKPHTFTREYIPFAPEADPRNTTSISGITIHAGLNHTVKMVCSACEDISTHVEDHTFVGNTCSGCQLNKDIPGKVSKLKGKQSGKAKRTKKKIAASWVQKGNRWVWQKARKQYTYTYKVKLSCRKPQNAFGFIVSMDKNVIQTGASIQKTANSNYSIAAGSSMTYSLSSSSKLKKATLYVAPVSKYGFIGKVSKVKVKLK